MNDLRPSTRALLDLGRLGDDPTDAAVGQNRSALAKKLGVAALGASAVAGSTSKAVAAVSAGTWTTLKTALLCGVVMLGGAVTWKVVGQRPAPAGNGSSARPATPAQPARPAQPQVVTPTVAPVETAAPAELSAPGEAVTPATRSAPSARPAAARSIKDELELVRAAQQALNRNDPKAALALLTEHAQKFPSGVLWEDREASRVFALCRLGNAAGARALADSFVRRAPKSPFVDRVRTACREPAPASSR